MYDNVPILLLLDIFGIFSLIANSIGINILIYIYIYILQFMGRNDVIPGYRVIFSLARYCQIILQTHLLIYTSIIFIRDFLSL